MLDATDKTENVFVSAPADDRPPNMPMATEGVPPFLTAKAARSTGAPLSVTALVSPTTDPVATLNRVALVKEPLVVPPSPVEEQQRLLQ